MAFTATVRFDLDKSVELTHHREIYGRDVRPAIEANELSAYARVQFHVVRVKPVEDEEAKLEAIRTFCFSYARRHGHNETLPFYVMASIRRRVIHSAI